MRGFEWNVFEQIPGINYQIPVFQGFLDVTIFCTQKFGTVDENHAINYGKALPRFKMSQILPSKMDFFTTKWQH